MSLVCDRSVWRVRGDHDCWLMSLSCAVCTYYRNTSGAAPIQRCICTGFWALWIKKSQPRRDDAIRCRQLMNEKLKIWIFIYINNLFRIICDGGMVLLFWKFLDIRQWKYTSPLPHTVGDSVIFLDVHRRQSNGRHVVDTVPTVTSKNTARATRQSYGRLVLGVARAWK